jgi:hypothetical protein
MNTGAEAHSYVFSHYTCIIKGAAGLEITLLPLKELLPEKNRWVCCKFSTFYHTIWFKGSIGK